MSDDPSAVSPPPNGAPSRPTTSATLRERLIAAGAINPRKGGVTAVHVKGRAAAPTGPARPVPPAPEPVAVSTTAAPEPSPLDAWPVFAAAVRERLEAGARTYGDRSFSRDPAELVAEVRQEVLDIVGWAYVLAVRLDRLELDLREVEAGRR